MTPDEFRESVLPQVISSWEKQCFCANPGFQKLLSFNFDDYGIGPVGLVDSEILIDAIIRQRFKRHDELESGSNAMAQSYTCPQCGATCTELYSEFSISMYQSTVTFHDEAALATNGLYLVGFFGFKQSEFDEIGDFLRTSSIDEFINQLRAA